MAIGQTPPLFMRMAIRVAPQRWGKMVGGARPEVRRFTRLVRKMKILFDRSGDRKRGLHEGGWEEARRTGG